MEDVIFYRRSPIMVKTIPKGTLLFRLSKSVKDDLRGYPKKDGTRCILSNHNVFFYPNPFVGKIALSEFLKSQGYTTMSIYILKNDIKVIWLLKPSKYARTIKNKKNVFMKRCSKTRKGCVDYINPKGSHAAFNPCLSDTIIKNYPDVVGSMAIAVGDMKRLIEGLKSKSSDIKKYFKFATDSNGNQSIPEMVLHPLKRRPSEDLIVNSGDSLETNYRLLTQIELSDNKLKTFMEKHASYNPDTYFYNYKE